MLINPPLPSHSYSNELITQPLGLAYIAAVLEKNGFSVEILDCPPLGYRCEDVKFHIEKLKPNVVGITSTTPTINNALKIAEIVKNVSLETKVFLGGPHVSFLDEETLMKAPYVDGIIRDEGEYTFLEIIKKINSGVSLENTLGLTLRVKNKIFTFPDRPLIEDLDSIPYPARHLLPPLDKYKSFGIKCPSISVLSSRGCPFQCKFCAVRKIFGNKFRARSSINIVGEIKELYEIYKVKYVTFVDDIFTLNRKRTIELCNEIKKLDVNWDCETRVDMIDKQLLNIMADSGCQSIFFGVESGDQNILNAMGKRITIEQIKNAFKWSKEAGLKTIASIILFYPGETKATIEKTIRFIKELDPDLAQFCIATPFPGTEFYEELLKQGLIQEYDWSKFDILTPVFALKEFSIDEMKRVWAKAYLSFYFRASYVFKRMLKRDWPTLKAFLYMLFKTVKSKVEKI
ncbi:radical SAM protein [Candidatus Bathyarchaeota archaeon]|nr:radical SAM protein [Candidatus Bathyarchaeota archaeon]